MRDITANLQGPVIVNIQACIGKQIICEGQNYPVRYRIWDALSRLNVPEEPVAPADPAAAQRTAEALRAAR